METLKIVFSVFILVTVILKAEDVVDNQWLQNKQAIIQDSSVVRYYTFEELKDSKSIVKEMKGSGADLVFVPFRSDKGMIDDLQVIEGRWPGKTAVRLNCGWYQGPSVDIENKQFSVEVWFRRNGPGTHKHTLSSNKERADGGIVASGTGYHEGWRLVTIYNQRQSLEFFLGGPQPRGPVRAFSYLSVPDGVWHHLAATWDGQEIKLYLNGMPAGSTKYDGAYVPCQKGHFFKVGYMMAGVGSVILDVDEVVIYNRVLSAQEIEVRGKAQTSSVEQLLSAADSFIRARKFKEARGQYERLKDVSGIDYGKQMALLNIAESYRLEKDYPNAHRSYDEFQKIEGLTGYYRIYGFFRESEVYFEQKNYNKARQVLNNILTIPDALPQHIFTTRLKIGDSYRQERKHSVARDIYEGLLREEETSSHPHEVNRLEIRKRLESIEGLADGAVEKQQESIGTQIVRKIDSARKQIYISPNGKDSNSGTKEMPFATIQRAQQEVKKLKEKGMPAGGIVVYLRGGRYFLQEGLLFGKDDSGTETAPVVYRGYPGEQVRIIGGKQITNFTPLTDEAILKRLPEEARGKV